MASMKMMYTIIFIGIYGSIFPLVVDGYVMKNRYAPPESMYSIRNGVNNNKKNAGNHNTRNKELEKKKKKMNHENTIAHDEANALVTEISNNRLHSHFNSSSSSSSSVLLYDDDSLASTNHEQINSQNIMNNDDGPKTKQISNILVKNKAKIQEFHFKWETDHKIDDLEWTKPFKNIEDFGKLPDNHIYQKYDWFTKYNISQVHQLLKKGKVHIYQKHMQKEEEKQYT